MHVEGGSLRWGGLEYGYRMHRHPDPDLEPVLFVSGAFQTMASWGEFVRAFRPRATVLLVDPPGTGESDVLPAELGFDFLARCVLHALDCLDVAVVNLVAASYGTPVGIRVAQLQPERLNRIVLTGTMKRIPARLRPVLEASIEWARQGRRTLLARRTVDHLMCRDPALPIARRRATERIMRSSVARLNDTGLRHYVANTRRLLRLGEMPLDEPVRAEALVFTGEHDTFTPPDACREIAEAFESGWFTTVRRADHLFHLERFDVAVELLSRFMRGDLGEPIDGCAPLVRIVRNPLAKPAGMTARA